MTQTAKAGKPNIFARFMGYLRDVRTEMRRVVWPSRPEVMNLSVVVITTLLIFVVMVFVFDWVVIRTIGLLEMIGG